MTLVLQLGAVSPDGAFSLWVIDPDGQDTWRARLLHCANGAWTTPGLQRGQGTPVAKQTAPFGTLLVERNHRLEAWQLGGDRPSCPYSIDLADGEQARPPESAALSTGGMLHAWIPATDDGGGHLLHADLAMPQNRTRTWLVARNLELFLVPGGEPLIGCRWSSSSDDNLGEHWYCGDATFYRFLAEEPDEQGRVTQRLTAVHEINAFTPMCYACSADGTRIASWSGSYDCVRVWNADGEFLFKQGTGGQGTALALSDDGRHVAVLLGGQLRVLEVDTGQEVFLGAVPALDKDG